MGRSIRFDLVTDARGYGRGMREAERFNKRFTGSITALQRTNSKGFKVNADTKKAESNFQQLEGAVRKFNVTALTLRNLTKLLKFPAIIAAGNALAGVFVSVAAEAVSIVSARGGDPGCRSRYACVCSSNGCAQTCVRWNWTCTETGRRRY